MFAQLLTPPYLPFAVSFVVMIGIGLIEAIGLGLGHLELDTDLDAGGHEGLLDWLGLGNELPILIWLTSLLGCFTLAGLAIQQGATAFAGAPLPWGLASYQPAVRLTHVRDSQADEILNQWRSAIGGRGHGISDRLEGRF
jgi:hypothetical protein